MTASFPSVLGKRSIAMILEKLVKIRYERNDWSCSAVLFGPAVMSLKSFLPATTKRASVLSFLVMKWTASWNRCPYRRRNPIKGPCGHLPASHYVTSDENLERARGDIRKELKARLTVLHEEGKLLEAERSNSGPIMTLNDGRNGLLQRY